ncbi:MAG: 3-hydroxyacyl-CoA dehydrogenase family protein [Ferruginibacter sp.]
MRFIVKGNEAQLEILKNAAQPGIEWELAGTETAINADAYFYLEVTKASVLPATDKPLFINSVTDTLFEIKATANVLRINGWPTFLERNSWEVAGAISEGATTILRLLNKEIIAVADEPGLIAARIVAAIINEAFFALEESVSTADEIDTAMKLGTNYPFGPFEWSNKIGLRNIYELLVTLSKTDERFIPSELLVTEAEKS